MTWQFHLWICARKNCVSMCKQICTSVFLAVLFTEAKTQQPLSVPTDRYVDKQKVVSPHNRMLHSLKKERNYDTPTT